jgi:hypothetical protein
MYGMVTDIEDSGVGEKIQMGCFFFKTKQKHDEDFRQRD